jgi:hypothetical protein
MPPFNLDQYNEAKFFDILKRRHKNDNPSPLVFVPMLLTELSNPQLVTDALKGIHHPFRR